MLISHCLCLWGTNAMGYDQSSRINAAHGTGVNMYIGVRIMYNLFNSLIQSIKNKLFCAVIRCICICLYPCRHLSRVGVYRFHPFLNDGSFLLVTQVVIPSVKGVDSLIIMLAIEKRHSAHDQYEC